jgi:hypothetical protein
MFSRVKKSVLILAVPAILAVGLGASSFAAPGGQEKVSICHNAGGKKYVSITVAMPALDAHMAHGDIMADEYGDCP